MSSNARFRAPQPCRYFNSPSGCKSGDRCTFAHDPGMNHNPNPGPMRGRGDFRGGPPMGGFPGRGGGFRGGPGGIFRGPGGFQRPPFDDGFRGGPNVMPPGPNMGPGGFKPIILKTVNVSCENISVVMVKREPLMYGAELEINNLPVSVCQTVARNTYHAQLGAITGACITVKGRLISNEEKMNLAMVGRQLNEKPLFLDITAPNLQSVDMALQNLGEKITSLMQTVTPASQMVATAQPIGAQGLLPTPQATSFPISTPNQSQANHNMFEEKIRIGMDSAPASFNLLDKLRGDDNVNVIYIAKEASVTLSIKGLGSGTKDPLTGQELNEPMFFHITSRNPESVDKARKLAESLLEATRDDLQKHLEQTAVSAPWQKTGTAPDPLASQSLSTMAHNAGFQPSNPELELAQKVQQYQSIGGPPRSQGLGFSASDNSEGFYGSPPTGPPSAGPIAEGPGGPMGGGSAVPMAGGGFNEGFNNWDRDNGAFYNNGPPRGGHFDSGRGGGFGRGGIDGGRGGFDGAPPRGGYNARGGGFESRGGRGSGFRGGRGGFDDQREGFNNSREGYNEHRGGGGFRGSPRGGFNRNDGPSQNVKRALPADSQGSGGDSYGKRPAQEGISRDAPKDKPSSHNRSSALDGDRTTRIIRS